MDEAVFCAYIIKDFYDLKSERPDMEFNELVELYLDDGYDLEGYEKYAYMGYRKALEEK